MGGEESDSVVQVSTMASTPLGSQIVLIGGASTRFAVTEAGKESADDPQAYFEYTRGGS